MFTLTAWSSRSQFHRTTHYTISRLSANCERLSAPEVHITGGLSNVSFGLPQRKVVNFAFIHLCLESGVDSGIIDPVQCNIGEIFDLDIESEPIRLARDVLLGRDDFCINYIQAWRAGRFEL